jgi:hypothetical protein
MAKTPEGRSKNFLKSGDTILVFGKVWERDLFRGTGHLRRWKALFLLNAVSKSY